MNNVHLHRRESGYSLVEVLVAMGILGSVLISIFTLFFMGRYNVYSGKQMTQAIGIANRVLEDLAPLNKQMIYNGAFAVTDTASGDATVTFANPGATYNNVAVRTTDATYAGVTGATNLSTENTGAGAPLFLGKWRTALGALGGNLTGVTAGNPGSYPNKASVTVILLPRNDPTNTPAQFLTATTMRVRVLVRWMERNRQRQVVVDTVKSF